MKIKIKIKNYLSFILLSVVSLPLWAQKASNSDIPALLENRVWKVMLPKDKRYTMSMEFRAAEWRTMYRYEGGKQTETIYSYSLCEDTIKIYKSGKKNYILQELTDSTLVFQYLPESLTIGVGPVKCVTDNSIQGQRKNEERLDSIWRKEDIWNKGVAKITGEPIKDLSTIESPWWAIWDYDLERYYVSQMKYPEELLKKNVAGYSVVMFSLDTLGLPRGINILTTIHKEFNKEVVRLTKELPHCLPCRDKNGKRMECFYTVYVPFLPQHYRDRVRADSIAEEELKLCFVEWEAMSYFQDRNPYAATNYIQEHLTYDPELLGDKKEAKGVYTIQIDSYGEVTKAETVRSCGMPEWDNQVLQIINGMPRWIPTVNHYGKGEYRRSLWAVPVVFKNDSLATSDKPSITTYDYDWLIETLSKSCKYPIKLQEKNQEGILRVAYEVGKDGHITHPKIVRGSNRKFKKATLYAFKPVMDITTALPTGKDTLQFQFKLDIPTTLVHPRTDVLVIGYSSCDTPVLMRYDPSLIAHTTESYLEAGVPICYLNERGDTIVPYGKYLYCQSDTIKKIGFVYENKPKDAKILCIDNAGKELFDVFKYDNAPDYVRDGLFRIADENGLIGFADSLGNVVIKPQFKFATPFENGKAKVAMSGNACADDDKEHSCWQSDEWGIIDRNGKKLLKYRTAGKDGDIEGLEITVSNGQTINYVYPTDVKDMTSGFEACVRMEDVNFDGQDDLLISLGQYGNQMIQYYDCYLWNGRNNQYEKESTFKEIENPQTSTDYKCIFSSSRVSAASYCHRRFEFLDGHFTVTSVLEQTTKGAKQPFWYTEKQYVTGKGLITLNKNVSEDKISSYWLSVITK